MPIEESLFLTASQPPWFKGNTRDKPCRRAELMLGDSSQRFLRHPASYSRFWSKVDRSSRFGGGSDMFLGESRGVTCQVKRQSLISITKRRGLDTTSVVIMSESCIIDGSMAYAVSYCMGWLAFDGGLMQHFFWSRRHTHTGDSAGTPSVRVTIYVLVIWPAWLILKHVDLLR